MNPNKEPGPTAAQRAEEEAIRRQHAAKPIRERPAGAIDRQSFSAILSLMTRFEAKREGQGLTLAEVADRMGIDAPSLSRLETGKMLNPTLATLHEWAEALGQKLDLDRQFAPEALTEKWVADITYIPTREGWLYLAGVEDLYSRRVDGGSHGAALWWSMRWRWRCSAACPMRGCWRTRTEAASTPANTTNSSWRSMGSSAG